jgi:hypothetical protein
MRSELVAELRKKYEKTQREEFTDELWNRLKPLCLELFRCDKCLEQCHIKEEVKMAGAYLCEDCHSSLVRGA